MSKSKLDTETLRAAREGDDAAIAAVMTSLEKIIESIVTKFVGVAILSGKSRLANVCFPEYQTDGGTKRRINKYHEPTRRMKLIREELKQESCVAALKAIRKFDPNRGIATFETYAYRAIHNRCHTIVNQREDVTCLSLDRTPAKPPRPTYLIERFRGLKPIQAKVVAARVGDVPNGGKVRTWVQVGKIVNRTPGECKVIFDMAAEVIRKAHEGEE